MVKNTIQKFNKNIKKVCFEKGMSQKYMCKLEFDRVYISNVENGKQNFVIAQ